MRLRKVSVALCVDKHQISKILLDEVKLRLVDECFSSGQNVVKYPLWFPLVPFMFFAPAPQTLWVHHWSGGWDLVASSGEVADCNLNIPRLTLPFPRCRVGVWPQQTWQALSWAGFESVHSGLLHKHGRLCRYKRLILRKHNKSSFQMIIQKYINYKCYIPILPTVTLNPWHRTFNCCLHCLWCCIWSTLDR